MTEVINVIAGDSFQIRHPIVSHTSYTWQINVQKDIDLIDMHMETPQPVIFKSRIHQIFNFRSKSPGRYEIKLICNDKVSSYNIAVN